MAAVTGTTVGSRVSALLAKIDGLSALGTDKTLRQMGELCIRVAMYSSILGVVVPRSRGSSSRKMKSLLNLTTAQFKLDEEEEGVLCESDRSIVVKARHRVTGKTFVIKELLLREEEEEEEEKAALRLLREACFMAACGGHPSLVRFHAVAQDPTSNHQNCIVMEHVGPSLLKVVRSQEVRRIVRQVLGGAMALHERGVVHGAINTETVLVADYANLVVKIGGAGQATMGNAMCYRAPEALLLQLPSSSSESQRKEGDSWSIGCLMAELLTGKPLFDEEGTTEEESLHEIFHVLGYPADKETIIQAIKLNQLETSTKNRLREMVPPEILSDEGFEVLQGLLTCNSNKRLTPASSRGESALQRPWFHHLHAAPESTTATALDSLSQVGCPLAIVKIEHCKQR